MNEKHNNAVTKKKYSALIIGSNFGYNAHFAALKKIDILSIDISSPNIKYKKIDNKKIRKFCNYKDVLKKNQYDIITCAVPPKIQEEVIQYIISKKISVKYLFFEKPYSTNIKFINKTLNYFKKRNIKISVNFIFPKLSHWKNLVKFLKNEKVKSVKYRWNFKQAFFVNLKKNWKINENEGGGIYFQYLIHLIYNLMTLFAEIEIINLIKRCNNKYKLTDYLSVKLMCDKKIPCEIEISNNATTNIHQLKIKSTKSTIELVNRSKEWTNKFKLIQNMKVKSKFENELSNERYMLTLKNIQELLDFKSTSEKKYLHNLSIIVKSHKIIENILLHNA